VTERDSIDEAMENVKDAFAAVVELYRELGKPFHVNAPVSKTA
jgi:predicted RNase H-like HicB family nuclease